MRTSATIVEKFERWLTSPGWAYCAMWHLPPAVVLRSRYGPPATPTGAGPRSTNGERHGSRGSGGSRA